MHFQEMEFKIKVLERAKCMQRNMWAGRREKNQLKKARKKKNMAKRENEKNVYRNDRLGYCLPHRVSTSAI